MAALGTFFKFGEDGLETGWFVDGELVVLFFALRLIGVTFPDSDDLRIWNLPNWRVIRLQPILHHVYHSAIVSDELLGECQ